MPTRFYLCSIVPHPTIPGRRRPSLFDHLKPGMSTSVCTDVKTGKTWCVVCVQAVSVADFADIDANPDCVSITESALDTAVDKMGVRDALKATAAALKNSDKVKIKKKLVDLGAKKNDFADSEAMGDVLLAVLQEHNPSIIDPTSMMVGQ